jgi:hypothetical protein
MTKKHSLTLVESTNRELDMAEITQFTTEQFITALREADAEHQDNQKKLSEAQRIALLEEENMRLKLIVADLTLRNEALKSLASKKW